ncbi:hypothetical protein [Anaerococcus vaginalis]|uniref:hypothetical protein n=1 Tax=Anaerococcus vaginalis TaxID=33037 RepID=UPI002431AFC1|nr:hypothetical protein [Anaerococcus vaginalis]
MLTEVSSTSTNRFIIEPELIALMTVGAIFILQERDKYEKLRTNKTRFKRNKR